MTRLTIAYFVFFVAAPARAAIIGTECEPKSPELTLARACYTGAMQVGPTNLRYLGIETDAHGNRYCQNTLLYTTTKVPSSVIRAVKDDTGQVRVHNYTVPPGPPGAGSLVLAGLPSNCIDRPSPDNPCWTANTLKVDFAGSPGNRVDITGAAPVVRDEKTKPLAETNTDHDSPELARVMVDDIDRRIGLAAQSVRAAASARVVKDRNLIKERAKQVLDCWELSRKFRAAKKLAKSDSADDADRKALLDAVQTIQATGLPPASGSGAGSGAGSAR